MGQTVTKLFILYIFYSTLPIAFAQTGKPDIYTCSYYSLITHNNFQITNNVLDLGAGLEFGSILSVELTYGYYTSNAVLSGFSAEERLKFSFLELSTGVNLLQKKTVTPMIQLAYSFGIDHKSKPFLLSYSKNLTPKTTEIQAYDIHFEKISQFFTVDLMANVCLKRFNLIAGISFGMYHVKAYELLGYYSKVKYDWWSPGTGAKLGLRYSIWPKNDSTARSAKETNSDTL